MTKHTGLLIGIMATSLAIPCGAKNTKTIANLKVNVRVFDLAQVQPELLHNAQEQATRLFRLAGITLSWVEGSPMASEAYQLEYRGQEKGAAPPPLACGTTEVCQIDLRLVALSPPRLGAGVLARALPFARSGIRVTIFYDRAHRILDLHGNSGPAILAHVLAHEIGHVLLGTDRHSSAGLMQASWGESDFSRMERLPMLLTVEQVRAIQEQLRARKPVGGEDGGPVSAGPQGTLSSQSKAIELR